MYIIGETEDEEPRYEIELLDESSRDEWRVMDYEKEDEPKELCLCLDQEVAQQIAQALDLFMRASHIANKEISGL